MQKGEVLLFCKGLVLTGFVELREVGVLKDVETGNFQAPFFHIIFHHKLYGVQHVLLAFTGEAENQMGDYVDGWRCLADTMNCINIILICVAAVYELAGSFVTGLKAEFYLNKVSSGDFGEAS